MLVLTNVPDGTYSVDITGSDGCVVSASIITIPNSTASDIDGNVYDEVRIDGVTWLRQNLKTTRFRNGDSIPLKNDPIDWVPSNSPAYSFNTFNNGISYMDTDHGAHYNWYAVNDPRGICPEGYHVPSAEWDGLILHLGALNVAGNKMKLITNDSYLQWSNPENQGDNSSGFSAVGSGLKSYSGGVYSDFSEKAYFWTSKPGANSDRGAMVKLRATSAVVSSTDTEFKTSGYSCRCVKDQ